MFFIYFLQLIKSNNFGEIYGINQEGSTFNPSIITIKKCSFGNVFSNSKGGGLLIENPTFSLYIYSILIYNCSALSTGGGIFFKGILFFMENSCIYKCGTRTLVSMNWGHAGAIETNILSNISFSSIIYCSPNSNFLGHALFSFLGGHQKMNNLNCTSNLALNTWSECVFSNDLSSHSINNLFFNTTGYDSLVFRVSSTTGLCENCNFIQNKVTIGAINLYNHNAIIKECIFYLNLVDLGIEGTGSNYQIIECVTDKSSFNNYPTFLNCKVGQIDITTININFNLCFNSYFTLNLQKMNNYYYLLINFFFIQH